MEEYLALKRKENLSCPTIWTNLEDVMLSGLPCPPSGDPGPGIEPTTLTSLALAAGFCTTSATWVESTLTSLPQEWTHDSSFTSQSTVTF